MKKPRVPINELDFTYSRSSGAGGQNVNKVNTKVTLSWDISKNKTLSNALKERFLKKYSRKITEEGVLVLQSQRFRQQARNVADVIEKLHELLEKVASPPKQRKATTPSKSAIRKRLSDKKKHSEKKKSRRLSYDE